MAEKILIVGSGVVGEATGSVLAERGFDVTFSDASPAVVSRLKGKGLPAFHVDEIKKPDNDIYMVSVPTYPFDLCRTSAEAEKLEQSMSPLEWCEIGIDYTKSASALVGRWIKEAGRYQLVVIRSAVLPGTTEDMIIPILQEQSGKTAGRDFGVCVNPEYLREKSNYHDIANPWVTVFGELDKKSGDILDKVYKWTTCPQYRLTIKEAEMQKFVHNLLNAAKISFFNEMRLVCERIGVNASSIFPIVVKSAEAIWNPEYGTKDYGPYGGKCLPKDTVAFLSWARKSGMEPVLLKAVIEVNEMLEKRLAAAPVK
jgi:UDPglucose 6-dehydrogenase